MSNARNSQTLTRLLELAALHDPHHTALISGEDRLSFSELLRLSRSTAQALSELGIGRGDRVAIWLPNIPLWVVSFFACAQLGAIVLAVNTRFRSSELSDVLGRSEAKALIFWPSFRGIGFAEILQDVDRECVRNLRAIIAYGERESPAGRIFDKEFIPARSLYDRPPRLLSAAHAESDCVMFTTSGTTSRPKLVLHSQRSIAQHATDTARAFGYDQPGSTLMAVTPFSGVSGFGLPVAAVAAKCPIVFAPVFDERASLKDMRVHQVTHTHANYEIIRRWFAAARSPDEFSSLKLVNCGSAIASVVPRAREVDVPLLSVYGSSELQARFSRQRPDLAPDRCLEAGGFPISPDARIRVTDPETRRVLAHAEPGELEVRAPSRMTEYFGDQAATATAITGDGYVRTGDCGCTRADGSFVFEARIADVLRLSGFLTSLPEIEAMVASHPGVAACQVVGAATERGLRAVAFVRPMAGMAFNEGELLQYCANRMARYKVPARILALDDFPMTAGSNAPKVQKGKLREFAEAALRSGDVVARG